VNFRILGSVAASLTMFILAGAAAPTPMASSAAAQIADPDGYYCMGFDECWPIAYLHHVYSDETMTTMIGSGSDICNGGPHVTTPNLPSGYAVKTRMHVCTGMGPYLPWDW